MRIFTDPLRLARCDAWFEISASRIVATAFAARRLAHHSILTESVVIGFIKAGASHAICFIFQFRRPKTKIGKCSRAD
jgi:hypothetical protein